MAFDGELVDRPKRKFQDGEQKKKEFSAKEVGCEFCPLDKVPGIQKVPGINNRVKVEVRGRELFVWGMSPGPEENVEGREFVGESGKLIWEELRLVNVTREMCDIQNVVRCFPADSVEDRQPALKMRDPSEKEIHCCSKFTKIAIEKSRARVHIIFGKVAAKSLLGDEFRKGNEPYRSERLKDQVLCMWHPGYLLRRGCRAGEDKAPNEKRKQWRKGFERAASLLGKGSHECSEHDGALRETLCDPYDF